MSALSPGRHLLGDISNIGPNHPEVARALNNLAVMDGNDGRFAEKERLLGPNSV
jgi:hypothetical protein